MIRPRAIAPGPIRSNTPIRRSGFGTPVRLSAAPDPHAQMIGLRASDDRASRQPPPWPAPHRASTSTQTTFSAGASTPKATAAIPSPRSPNTAPATGRKTKPFHRITPWKTLVKAGSLIRSIGLASTVTRATVRATATVATATGPAAPPAKSARQTAGIRKAG